jgi:transposase
VDPKAIAAIVTKITDSPLSVADYFRRNNVPFSKAQYYRYKDQLKKPGGIANLQDGRSRGNRRTLTDEAKQFIRWAHTANPELNFTKLADLLEDELKLSIHPTTVSAYMRAEGLEIKRPPSATAATETIDSACGGLEIIGAVAMHLGWTAHTAKKIVAERERFRRSVAFRDERVELDLRGRIDGQFTADYNGRRDVREGRFASIEDKREDKNYSRMKLFEASPFVIERKCLAVLALPVITVNGTVRSVNSPLGNALEHFCGFNYKHATIDKVLRDLKYLGISEALLRDQIPFWQQHWPDFDGNLPMVCYYVDGNTKALWSSKRVKQNKVTMNGRVMGCMEQVYIHDGYGHPVYLETYSGKAPVGEHILRMAEQIGESLEVDGPPLKVKRVLVMDAASNGVSTLRAFAKQTAYHYITSLDDNQWNPRKVIEQGPAQRYRYGKATLRECRLELEDSKEKGYILVVRAILIEWDHGKRTVLLTDLPEEIGASLVVKAYFDRWPCQELQFRGMKHATCLNRAAGYGKKEIPDENVIKKQQKLRANIAALKRRLRAQLDAIASEEARIDRAIKRERRIKALGTIVDGERRLPEAARTQLKEVGAEIAAAEKRVKAIRTAAGKPMSQLDRYEKELLRIHDKDTVYRVDVELDQIMAFFRMALANTAAWFLTNCLKETMTLARLFNAILMLPARIELTHETHRVILKRNPKDADLMDKLESALRLLTDMGTKDLEGRKIEFQLSM